MPTSKRAEGKVRADLRQIQTVAEEMGEPVTISVAVKVRNQYVLAVYFGGTWTLTFKEEDG